MWYLFLCIMVIALIRKSLTGNNNVGMRLVALMNGRRCDVRRVWLTTSPPIKTARYHNMCVGRGRDCIVDLIKSLNSCGQNEK
jgi:hypothetical protein